MSASESKKQGTDWIRLASSAPAVLGSLGLIIYAVVRIGHDAFYNRFGVTAEEVGLSHATILGRAALYFIFFLASAVALLGFSVVIARSPAALGPAKRKWKDRWDRDDSALWASAAVGVVVLIAAFGLGGVLLAGVEGDWLLATVVGIVIPLAIAATFGNRFARGHRAALVVFFVVLAGWAASVSFVVANSGIESSPGAESLSKPTRWLLFGFCALAVAVASASVLRQFEAREAGDKSDSVEDKRREIYLITLTLLALLPLALVFVAPGAGRFVTEGGDRTIVAFMMWLVLFGFVILGFKVLGSGRDDERASIYDILLLVSLLSVFAGSAFYLAWLRGVDLANQALAGSRIVPSGFSMFSVRSDIVCLRPVSGSSTDSQSSADSQLPDSPMIYLGESPNNMLVLFDLERSETIRLREELTETDIGAPQRLPVLIPAGDVIVDVARLISPGANYVVPVRWEKTSEDGKWECRTSR